MIITEILARNARMYAKETALIERDPANDRRVEITWEEFDRISNRIANALIEKGVRKGDKVIHLMMNCLEWLPAYFGILRTGAWAVPLNFRFMANDIQHCAEIAEARVMIFGPEFVDRIDQIKDDLTTIDDFIFVGPDNLKPEYAESFDDFCKQVCPRRPMFPFHSLMRPPCISRPVPPGRRSRSCSPKETLKLPASLRTNTTVKPMKIRFCASLLCITPVQRCTGSGILLWGQKGLSLKE